MSISRPEDFVTCKVCNHPKSVHVAMGMGNAPPFCKVEGCNCPNFTLWCYLDRSIIANTMIISWSWDSKDAKSQDK